MMLAHFSTIRSHKNFLASLPSRGFERMESKILKVISYFTTQKMKFPIKDFFSKCDQIRKQLQIWLHLLKKSVMETFIFRVVFVI